MAQRAAAMTAQIEREIDHTRRELAVTLAALERKLAARYLVEKGFDMFKDSLGDDYGLKRSLEIVRDNPVPIALIAIHAICSRVVPNSWKWRCAFIANQLAAE